MGRSGYAGQHQLWRSRTLLNLRRAQHCYLVPRDRKACHFKIRKAQIARASLMSGCTCNGGEGGCDQEQIFHDDTPLGLEVFPPRIP